MRRAAIIVAAGTGQRAGGGLPKQYRPLAGEPMVRWSARTFVAHPAIDAVHLVIAKGQEEIAAASCAGLDMAPPLTGGASRQETVLNALEQLAGQGTPPTQVLIHDAARPFVSAEVIDRVIAALARHRAVLPVVPVVDTIKRVHGQTVIEGVARDDLARAQTPQGFDFATILEAHRREAGRAHTDDAAVAAAQGLAVATVAGQERNLKITTAEDLVLADRSLAAPRRWRTAQGYDVHRLGSPGPMMLCGVEIAGDLTLIGHSDADVGLHALTDAVLGTIAAGDIGSHFPPSEARWRGVASDIFLRHAVELVRAAGGRLDHVDLTLICERPKIGPLRASMRAAVAAITGLEIAAVSIKATTSEGLGFTGRGEGIAAMATATASFAGDDP